jgi:hypothetical protein
MSDLWYYARDKRRVGPVPLGGLRELAASGALRSADMVWREGTQKWVTLGSVVGPLPPQAATEKAAPPAGTAADGCPQPPATALRAGGRNEGRSMMYRITGADAQTGRPREVSIVAVSQDEAVRRAEDMGIVVAEAGRPPAPGTPLDEIGQAMLTAFLIVVGLGALGLLFYYIFAIFDAQTAGGFVFWGLVGGVIGAVIASRKGYFGLLGFIAGAALGPIFIWLLLLSSPNRRGLRQKKCPYCAEWVRREAVVCKFCRMQL